MNLLSCTVSRLWHTNLIRQDRLHCIATAHPSTTPRQTHTALVLMPRGALTTDKFLYLALKGSPHRMPPPTPTVCGVAMPPPGVRSRFEYRRIAGARCPTFSLKTAAPQRRLAASTLGVVRSHSLCANATRRGDEGIIKQDSRISASRPMATPRSVALVAVAVEPRSSVLRTHHRPHRSAWAPKG